MKFYVENYEKLDKGKTFSLRFARQNQKNAYPINPWQEADVESYRVTIWSMPCVCLMIKKFVISFIKVAITYLFVKDLCDWLVRIFFPHNS